ncbi:DUF664 domain-containing protein [Allobranchiibius sp. CTAmp26]|nr:DUF664 domain-containing protein [Allobranchiibius sp. CTAmp26]
MTDDIAKANLYGYLQYERTAVLAKLDGLSEYEIRRPLTVTGTNLLGLVKHLTTWEARYLGDVFDRPFPERLPRWDVEAELLADMWVTADESRSDVVDRYRRVWDHSDATVNALTLIPWAGWPGGRTPRCPCSTSSCTCWPKPVGTLATPTSCANSSMARWESTPRPWPLSGTIQSSGRSGARRSRRPPGPPVDVDHERRLTNPPA